MKKCNFRPQSWQAREVGCPLDHCSVCGGHDDDAGHADCKDSPVDDDDCENCRDESAGDCPNCYAATGVGCAHGDWCAMCRAENA